MSIISLQGVSKDFVAGNTVVRALDNIDLEVEEGDIYGIVGLSGAGKSTLVRCINLLEKPTEGKVIVDGKSLLSLDRKALNKERKDIGMIFQQFNLLMQRTAIQNVCFPLELCGMPRGEARKRAEELLEVVDLGERAKSYPSQLSGGQKQRVAIARALATDPKVLLCDEATSALDPQTTRSILRLLRKINKEIGITIVIITHQMSVVRQICNKVAIIEKGSIVERGGVEEVFANPKSQAGRRLFFPAEDEPDFARRTSIHNRVRLAFDDNRAYEPVVSNMILELGAPVNILYARMESVAESQKGQMVLGLSEDEEKADQQRRYLKAHGVTFTELTESDENGPGYDSEDSYGAEIGVYQDKEVR